MLNRCLNFATTLSIPFLSTLADIFLGMLRRIIVIILIFGLHCAHAQRNLGDLNNPNTQNANGTRNDSTTVKKRKGKILNDSLQVIYGPHTSFYFYEEDWFNNTDRLYVTDTSITNFHHYSFVHQQQNKIHNLGNLATAANPIFYQLPKTIGTRNGISAFDFIELDETNIKHYNTKSPFSSWYYAQGGEGRSFLDASLAQNVNERINVGFLYRRLTNKLLIGTKKQDNQIRHVDHQNIMVHGSAISKNQRYKIAAYLSFARHRLIESGGLSYDQGLLTDIRDLYNLEQGELDNRLSDANGLEQKNKAHLYHQYTLIDSSNLQVFHSLDWLTRKNSFDDNDIGTIDQIYRDFLISTDTTQTSHTYQFKELNQRFGVKWRNKRLFMAAYYRIKNFSGVHTALGNEQIPYDLNTQHFLGFIGDYTINDTTSLSFEGEQLLFKDYRLSATLKTKFLTAKYQRGFYSPSLMQSYYYGQHFIWSNNFKNTLTDQLEGSIRIPLKSHVFEPYASITNAVDYIYFDEQTIPEQTDEALTLLQLGIKLKGRFAKKLLYSGEFIYTENSNTTAFRSPRFFSNLQVAFENDFFKGKLPAQVGLDFHWRSAYFADAYMPITQVFYRQNIYEVGNYPVLDFFINGRINRVRMFFKATNILNGLLGEGYFSTINYMEQPTQIEFGLNWLFFD